MIAQENQLSGRYSKLHVVFLNDMYETNGLAAFFESDPSVSFHHYWNAFLYTLKEEQYRKYT